MRDSGVSMDIHGVIEEFDRVFTSVLHADDAPLSPLAVFWYEDANATVRERDGTSPRERDGTG